MIGIDAGNSLDRPPTGVAVYARNLIWELARLQPEEEFCWLFRSNRCFRAIGKPRPPNVKRWLMEGPGAGFLAPRLRLFHGLNQRLPHSPAVPRIATFHDLFAMTGEYSTAEFRRRFSKLAREAAGRADHIIAVSSHTASQIENRLGVPRSRITVIHHGVEPMDRPSPVACRRIIRRLGISRPFVLHVGSLQVRKNIERIVAAFEAGGGDTELVLAGPMGYGARGIVERIDRSAARDRILLVGHVGDEVRTALYATAEALLFPSLEEGFGLPVVEAFSAGLPVIASNVSALPEVAGDAALLVDPRSCDEIAHALEAVLGDESLRNALRQMGETRARRFTWQRCAAETWRVYGRFRLR